MSFLKSPSSFYAACVLGAALAFSPQTTKAQEEVDIAAGIALIWAPVYVAEQQEFFAQHGLEANVSMFPSGRTSQEAIVGGAVDWGTVAETPVMFAAMNDIPVRIIGTMADYEYFDIVATEDIQSIEDLAGKRIGYAQGTNAHVYLSRLVEEAGVEGDVTPINLSPTDMLSALSNEQIDAFIWVEPHRSQALELDEGFHVMQVPGLYKGYSAIVALQSTIDENPEVLVNSLRALMDAVDYINENKDEVVQSVAERVQMDQEIASQEFERIPFEIRMDRAELIEEMQRQAEWAIEAGLVASGTEIPDFDQIIVSTIHEQATQR